MKKQKVSKLDELRSLINAAFENATEADTIKQVGAIQSKLDEVADAQSQQEKEYTELLTNYKDAVLHGNYDIKKGAGDPEPVFDLEVAFKQAFNIK